MIGLKAYLTKTWRGLRARGPLNPASPPALESADRFEIQEAALGQRTPRQTVEVDLSSDLLPANRLPLWTIHDGGGDRTQGSHDRGFLNGRHLSTSLHHSSVQ